MLRTPDPIDGRFTLATLTERGVEALNQSTPEHVRIVNRLVLEPLTRQQKRQLLEINRRILRAIRVEEGWQPPTTATPTTET